MAIISRVALATSKAIIPGPAPNSITLLPRTCGMILWHIAA
ncbi:MAG: hypothetical protein ACOX6O_07760 [Christensenellales bacterium]